MKIQVINKKQEESHFSNNDQSYTLKLLTENEEGLFFLLDVIVFNQNSVNLIEITDNNENICFENELMNKNGINIEELLHEWVNSGSKEINDIFII